MRASPNTFAIFLPDGVVDVRELMAFHPARRIQAFRSMLNRLGAGDASGFLVAALHGEYDPTTRLFHLHVHGLASEEMLEVVDRVRRLPGYRKLPREAAPVQIGRKPLQSLPHPLSYIWQSFWPSRWRGEIDGERRRGRRCRIPEPYHTAYLLWLDKWSLEDVTLLMGLHVTPEGFALTDRQLRTRKGGHHMK